MNALKNISLFQGIFYGVLVFIALIGLFVFATYTNRGGAGGVGTVTIWGTLPAAEVRQGLTEAIKLNTSLKAVTYVEKPAETLPTDLSAAIATGNPPDLVLASQEELLALEPFLQAIPAGTLSARTFASTFTGGAQVYAATGGGYWGVPLLIDPLVLFYNRAILASVGIASPPATWEALTGLVPQVATYTATKHITRGLIALGTYGNIHNARGILSTLFLQLAVPLTSQSTTGVLAADLGRTSTGAVASGAPGEAVVRFYTQFADPSKVSYTWDASLPDSQAAFSQGNLALYLGYVSEARFLKEAAPNLGFDVAPVPQPATAATKAGYGLIYAGMIPRGAKNASGAYKAAIALAATPELAALASATGLAPATAAALAVGNTTDPVAATAASAALYTDGWLSPVPASVDTIFSAMITDVITGRASIPEALTTAERSLEALVQS